MQDHRPQVPHGKIERLEFFPSKHIPARHIDIWLPDSYAPQKPHPVLYMHDGQMLFDPTITWNGQCWGVSQVIHKLSQDKEIRVPIIVGVWNPGEARHAEYFPQKPFAKLPSNFQDYLRHHAKRDDGSALLTTDVYADDYLRFLVSELKPYIDQHYVTLPDQQNTFIAGSSMGGLISLYALCEYPKVFHGAACLSTHWVGIHRNENNPIPDAFFNYLDEALPSPANHRIYFDYGTETLDALYEPHQLRVDELMQRKGYNEQNWQTLKFEGADHSENAWQERLHIPLKFLLAP